MKLAIVIQLGWVAINRLLKIGEHAEVPRAWIIAFVLKQLAGSLYGPRDFEQNKKLLWIGVLSFVDNDTIILLTNALRHVRQTQQFGRGCDLIRVSDCAAS